MGGEEFTITGNDFDAELDCDNSGSVMIGDHETEIVSWTSSEIVARSVATSDFGVSDVVVYVYNKGMQIQCPLLHHLESITLMVLSVHFWEAVNLSSMLQVSNPMVVTKLMLSLLQLALFHVT